MGSLSSGATRQRGTREIIAYLDACQAEFQAARRQHVDLWSAATTLIMAAAVAAATVWYLIAVRPAHSNVFVPSLVVLAILFAYLAVRSVLLILGEQRQLRSFGNDLRDLRADVAKIVAQAESQQPAMSPTIPIASSVGPRLPISDSVSLPNG